MAAAANNVLGMLLKARGLRVDSDGLAIRELDRYGIREKGDGWVVLPTRRMAEWDQENEPKINVVNGRDC